MKFDDILVEIGEFGRYQKRLYFLVCLPAIPVAFLMLSTVFILATPDHRCSLPNLRNDTYKIQNDHHLHMVNQSIPSGGKKKYAQCSIYNASIINQGPMNSSQKASYERSCESWVYDKSVFQSTVISEFDMICSKKEFRSHANMILMAGLLVGALGLGLLSDVIGRKMTFLTSLIVVVGSGIGLAFAPNFEAFVALRFINGAASTGTFMCMFVIGMELVGPSKRTIAGIVIELFWCVGLFALGAIAFGLRDWHHLQLAISVPLVLFFSYWWLLPESPRWLMSKGRLDEAASILKKAAEVNKVCISPKMLALENLESEQQEKFWKMFTSPVLIIRSMIIFFNWLVVSMVYYGLGLNVGSLAGDVYLNFTIANIVEAVSYVGCILLLDRVGRRKLHCFTMLLGGVACICTMFPVMYGDKSHEWITTALAMIGKLGVSAAFAIIYVFSAELFPTVLRNSGMGCSSFSARIGAMISPYIADLGKLVEGDFSTALPLIVFGAASVAVGLMSLYLPETLNKKLPETIEDAKNFGKESVHDKYQPNNTKGEASANGEIPKYLNSETVFTRL